MKLIERTVWLLVLLAACVVTTLWHNQAEYWRKQYDAEKSRHNLEPSAEVKLKVCRDKGCVEIAAGDVTVNCSTMTTAATAATVIGIPCTIPQPADPDGFDANGKPYWNPLKHMGKCK